MSIDVTIQPINIGIAKDAADERIAQIVVTTGTPLPFEDPNTGGPVMAPTDMYRIPLNKKSAEQLGQALIDLAGTMKDESGIQVAKSLDGVDKAAKVAQSLRG